MKNNISHDKNEDRRLLQWLSISGVAIAVISIFLNYQLNFGFYLFIITSSGIVVYGVLSIAIYKGLGTSISQYILVYTTLIYTNLLWYFEHGKEGPILYFFLIIFTLIIFIWNNNRFITGTIILVINLLILFCIDYYFPNFVSDYKDEQTKTFDIYTSFIMFGIVTYTLMYAVKKSYIKEYEKAKQSDRLKTAFIENISHEIRTPLNAIIGFSSLLEEDDLSKEQRKEYHKLIYDSNTTLLRVIDNILQVSLLQTNQLVLNINDCQLNKIIDSLFITYSKLLNKDGKSAISIQVSKPTVNTFVKTDKAKLSQVLINLLDNAVKFTHTGTIDFGYIVEENTILFHVSDTGIGIKRKYQDLIFDRFYKVEDDKGELFRGTGIGLFLTKKIIESFGGDIWVKSTFTTGSTFYFTIPKIGYHESD